ncbi:tetratricopeptide repeat protein [Kineothrix sp. MB12-C1]|uniref:tetratricopeptide repeat protein n=1 Tax=Kineothrix sp. MB12-C1 TaxID=3070215 RepID=UPI0027D22779|nr:tetratricopeptide repeat protein [Kineothrix sp. MB12-C1]WMC92856.1 tetratricopeptide repeat protein [Kineothrix sp. MB12-C1]
MNAEIFFKQLDELFQKNEIDKVEPYLLRELEKAREAEDYPGYIVIGNEMIGFYRSISSYKKAFDIAEDVLLLMEEIQLDTSEHFATTLLNTATAYRAAGELESAYRYYLQALKIYEELLAEDDYRFAGLYNNMSLLLEQMDKNEGAIELTEKALSIVRKLEGSEVQQATSLTNLALLYFKLDRAKDASEALKDALLLFEQAGNGDETDAHYSAALAGVGEAYYRMGDYKNALLSYEKALAEVKKHFGENQSYGVLCENCAAVCECLKEEEKAQQYRTKAEEIYQGLKVEQ